MREMKVERVKRQDREGKVKREEWGKGMRGAHARL